MRLFITILTTLLVMASLAGCGTQLEGSPERQRLQIQSMEKDTIQKLYAGYPEARQRIKNAEGYAVFDASGGKFLWGGLDHGNGVVVDNHGGKPGRTYMKMFELQPGVGFGFSNFRLVFIFSTRQAMNDFIYSGWQFGARTDAAAKNHQQGGAYDMGFNVAPGITLYQLTQEGVIIGLSLTGAKYWRNDELN